MDLEYYEISVPDRNDSIMRVNLDEVYYNLRLTWNAYGGFWMLSIYDIEIGDCLPIKAELPELDALSILPSWEYDEFLEIEKRALAKFAKTVGVH